MKSVVLAGGKGTRLAPYTHILPKPLMPIGDMPILEILMRQMKACGIHQVTLTVGHLSELIRTFFGDGSRIGLDIRYSYEECPLGTAGPLAMIDDLSETFLVCNGDVLTDLNINRLVEFHNANGGAATIAMYCRKVKIDLGVIRLNGGNTIQDYIEKPTIEYNVSMGIYMFEPSVLRFIPKGQHLDFPDLVKILLATAKRWSATPSTATGRTWAAPTIISRR
jgi:NDP-mannose synthase